MIATGGPDQGDTGAGPLRPDANRLPLPGGWDVCLAWTGASTFPEGDAWLTPAEGAILDRFRVSKRASDWRLGRWVAKEAVARALGTQRDVGVAGARPTPADVEILPGPGGGPRARVLIPGDWPAVSVSLSHSAGTGFAAACVGVVRLGCDIEEIAPRSDAFVSDYFTAEEAAWIRAGDNQRSPAGSDQRARAPERHVRANLLWSAKESALKALGEGLRKDTRGVVVEVEGLEAPGLEGAGGAWRLLHVSSADGSRFAGWWQLAGGLVWTVVGQG